MQASRYAEVELDFAIRIGTWSAGRRPRADEEEPYWPDHQVLEENSMQRVVHSMRHVPAHRDRVAWMATIAVAGLAGCGGDLAVDPELRVDTPVLAAAPLARIAITEHGMNRVDSPHTVTGSVTVAADAGQPFLPAVDGITINFAIASGPGSLSASSCTTAGGTGACSVTLNSDVTGVTEVSASSTFTVGSTVFNLTTNYGDNSGPLSKKWVDAQIAIEPLTDTNLLNEEHTFTVTVSKDFGDGNGFVAAAGETVTATQSGSLAPVALGGTCTTGTTDGSGQCTFTANSSSPGTLTLTASSTVTFGGAHSPIASSTRTGQELSITVTTDRTGNNSGPATKTWIGAPNVVKPASISIDPAVYSAVAGSSTASGTFRIANQSGHRVAANVATIVLALQRVARGRLVAIPNVTCGVTNIRNASGNPQGPGLPYTIEPPENPTPSGFAFVDFTCTRSDGTFASGWELKLFQEVIVDPGKNNPYRNTSTFKIP
jgi:hypothetical protein